MAMGIINWIASGLRRSIGPNASQTGGKLLHYSTLPQVLCRDIFLTSWPSTALLGRYQPSMRQHDNALHDGGTRQQQRTLSQLLEECASPQFGRLPIKHPAVENVMALLRRALEESLEDARIETKDA
jgi:hypothetical protein